MKKLLIAIVLFCTLFTTTNVSGETLSTNLTLKQEKIMVESKENCLFVTFDNQQKAVSWINIKAKNLLREIQVSNSLADFSEESWMDYRDCLTILCEDDDFYSHYCDDIKLFLGFIDIFENKYKNLEIIQLINDISEGKNTENSMAMLLYLMPFNSTYVQEKINNNSTIQRASGTFNTSLAISYANTYATNPNTSSYHYFSGGDCANFVSQIFEAAGLIPSTGTNPKYGWWHNYSNGEHSHSLAWSYAHHLAVYFTVKYSTISFNSFTQNVYPGSAIVLDFENDGDWDHAGFVVDKGTVLSSSGYYDIRIAQHTKNYNSWVSSSTNGWENYNNSGRYGRIRV